MRRPRIVSKTKTKKLQRKVAAARPYLNYFKEMRKAGKQPMTKYHWDKADKTDRKLARLPKKERLMAGVKD